MKTRLERVAAWVWDNLPGGVPAQLWVWRWITPLAHFCEDAANRRDEIERTSWDER